MTLFIVLTVHECLLESLNKTVGDKNEVKD